jgi:hypothetical protein
MAKKLALVLGIVLVILGVLGYVSNPLIGASGLFETNGLHNLVNLVIGIILLIVAFAAPGKSGLWLKIFGIIYLILVVLGFLMVPSGGMLLGMATNVADHWLHLVLGVVLLVGGFMGGSSSSPTPPAPMQTM